MRRPSDRRNKESADQHATHVGGEVQLFVAAQAVFDAGALGVEARQLNLLGGGFLVEGPLPAVDLLVESGQVGSRLLARSAETRADGVTLLRRLLP